MTEVNITIRSSNLDPLYPTLIFLNQRQVAINNSLTINYATVKRISFRVFFVAQLNKSYINFDLSLKVRSSILCFSTKYQHQKLYDACLVFSPSQFFYKLFCPTLICLHLSQVKAYELIILNVRQKAPNDPNIIKFTRLLLLLLFIVVL